MLHATRLPLPSVILDELAMLINGGGSLKVLPEGSIPVLPFQDSHFHLLIFSYWRCFHLVVLRYQLTRWQLEPFDLLDLLSPWDLQILNPTKIVKRDMKETANWVLSFRLVLDRQPPLQMRMRGKYIFYFYLFGQIYSWAEQASSVLITEQWTWLDQSRKSQ